MSRAQLKITSRIVTLPTFRNFNTINLYQANFHILEFFFSVAHNKISVFSLLSFSLWYHIKDLIDIQQDSTLVEKDMSPGRTDT